jgi:hypothetical protein
MAQVVERDLEEGDVPSDLLPQLFGRFDEVEHPPGSRPGLGALVEDDG